MGRLSSRLPELRKLVLLHNGRFNDAFGRFIAVRQDIRAYYEAPAFSHPVFWKRGGRRRRTRLGMRSSMATLGQMMGLEPLRMLILTSEDLSTYKVSFLVYPRRFL